MTVVNTLTLNVEGKAHNYAKIYAALLTDEFQRKRAYASIVALYALITPNLMLIITVVQFSFPISISKLSAEGKYKNGQNRRTSEKTSDSC